MILKKPITPKDIRDAAGPIKPVMAARYRIVKVEPVMPGDQGLRFERVAPQIAHLDESDGE